MRSPSPAPNDKEYQRVVLGVPLSQYPGTSPGDCPDDALAESLRNVGITQAIELRQVEKRNATDSTEKFYVHLRIGHAFPQPAQTNSIRDQRKFKLDPQEELLYLGCERRLRKDGGHERHYFQRVRLLKKYKNGERRELPDCKDGCTCYRRRADVPIGQFTISGWIWAGPYSAIDAGSVRRIAQPSGKATLPCDTEVRRIAINGHYIWVDSAFLSKDGNVPLKVLTKKEIASPSNEESFSSKKRKRDLENEKISKLDITKIYESEFLMRQQQQQQQQQFLLQRQQLQMQQQQLQYQQFQQFLLLQSQLQSTNFENTSENEKNFNGTPQYSSGDESDGNPSPYLPFAPCLPFVPMDRDLSRLQSSEIASSDFADTEMILGQDYLNSSFFENGGDDYISNNFVQETKNFFRS